MNKNIWFFSNTRDHNFLLKLKFFNLNNTFLHAI